MRSKKYVLLDNSSESENDDYESLKEKSESDSEHDEISVKTHNVKKVIRTNCVLVDGSESESNEDIIHNVQQTEINHNIDIGCGVHNIPVFLPLRMEEVNERLEVLADQIQNIPARGGDDSNWLKPEIFSGNDDDVCHARTWIDRFVGFVELKGQVPEGQVIRYLRLVTKGPAYQWSLGLLPNLNLEQVRQAFLARFVTANTLRYKLRQDFESRTQRDGENVGLYIADMQQMGNALELDENTIKHAIIRGLVPNIRSLVLTLEPANLEETIQKAKVASMAVHPENTISANAMRRFDDRGIDDIVKLVKTQQEENAVAQANINKLTNLVSDLLLRENTPPRSVSFDPTVSAQRRSHQTSVDRRPSVNSINEVRCFYCDEPGHFIRDCRARQYKTGRYHQTRSASFSDGPRHRNNNLRPMDRRPRSQSPFRFRRPKPPHHSGN